MGEMVKSELYIRVLHPQSLNAVVVLVELLGTVLELGGSANVSPVLCLPLGENGVDRSRDVFRWALGYRILGEVEGPYSQQNTCNCKNQ